MLVPVNDFTGSNWTKKINEITNSALLLFDKLTEGYEPKDL
jgi:hypothetical protein